MYSIFYGMLYLFKLKGAYLKSLKNLILEFYKWIVNCIQELWLELAMASRLM